MNVMAALEVLTYEELPQCVVQMDLHCGGCRQLDIDDIGSGIRHEFYGLCEVIYFDCLPIGKIYVAIVFDAAEAIIIYARPLYLRLLCR